MNLKRYLLLLGKPGFLSNSLITVPDKKQYVDIPSVVVFGRPGAGKTTVADEALRKFENDTYACLGLDLDICVPEWMKENFAAGIYPKLEQRRVFAEDCCEYVRDQLAHHVSKGSKNVATLISFSFVNQDLREVYRSNFPNAKWILMDTSEDEAAIRISRRKDHFYKGEKAEEKDNEDTDTTKEDTSTRDDADNSEWRFAPVLFDHVVLDGRQPIDETGRAVLQVLKDEITRLRHK